MIGCNSGSLLPVQFTQDQITAFSESGVDKVGLEKDKKGKGLFGRFFGGGNKDGGNEGLQYPNKQASGQVASEQGKVKEVDVTSNKFTRPDRERKPLPEETFPYKGKRKARYVEV
jgi:hypothetical protein